MSGMYFLRRGKIQCVRVKFALTDGLFCVLKVMTVE